MALTTTPEQLTLDLEPETGWHDWFLALPVMPGTTTTVREASRSHDSGRCTLAPAHVREGARLRPAYAHSARRATA